MNMLTMIPLALYLILTLGLAFWVSSYSSRAKSGFLAEYFVGSRSLGGFALAMAVIVTYISASSFLGGPGIAYSFGLSWVLLSMIQVPTAFLTLGVLGKKLSLAARRSGAITLNDILRLRYKNDHLVLVANLAMIVFFMAICLAQFIGGARLLQAVTGLPYALGLSLFGLTVIVYTSIGGFRAVALTDALQGIVMLVAAVVILGATIHIGGGVANLTRQLAEIDPNLLRPSTKDVQLPMLFSFWVLVGIAILGLPQTVHKCLGYKDTKSLHQAMLIGSLLIGFIMLCMHLSGVFARVLIPDLASPELAIPKLTLTVLSPVLAGVFIAGPLAAIMSTVDSMLLMIAASLVKDIYLQYRHKGDISKISPTGIKRFSFITTIIIGLLVFFAALNPPTLLVWINLFAFGGLEAVFFLPLMLGLFWKKANASGAFASMLAGLFSYIILVAFKINCAGVNHIVPSLIIGLIAFILVNPLGKKPDQETLSYFGLDG